MPVTHTHPSEAHLHSWALHVCTGDCKTYVGVPAVSCISWQRCLDCVCSQLLNLHLEWTLADYKGLLWIIPKGSGKETELWRGRVVAVIQQGSTQQVTDRSQVNSRERLAGFQTFLIFSRIPAVVGTSWVQGILPCFPTQGLFSRTKHEYELPSRHKGWIAKQSKNTWIRLSVADGTADREKPLQEKFL